MVETLRKLAAADANAKDIRTLDAAKQVIVANRKLAKDAMAQGLLGPPPIDPAQEAAAVKIQSRQRAKQDKERMSQEPDDDTLRAAFYSFAGFGRHGQNVTQMEGKNFLKAWNIVPSTTPASLPSPMSSLSVISESE